MAVYTVKIKNLNPDVADQIRPLIELCGGKDRTRKKSTAKNVVGIFQTKEQARDFRGQVKTVPKLMQ